MVAKDQGASIAFAEFGLPRNATMALVTERLLRTIACTNVGKFVPAILLEHLSGWDDAQGLMWDCPVELQTVLVRFQELEWVLGKFDNSAT